MFISVKKLFWSYFVWFEYPNYVKQCVPKLPYVNCFMVMEGIKEKKKNWIIRGELVKFRTNSQKWFGANLQWGAFISYHKIW